MYKLAPNDEKYHATETQRKYFPAALEYCTQNNVFACRVNSIFFRFFLAEFGNLSDAPNGAPYAQIATGEKGRYFYHPLQKF